MVWGWCRDGVGMVSWVVWGWCHGWCGDGVMGGVGMVSRVVVWGWYELMDKN